MNRNDEPQLNYGNFGETQAMVPERDYPVDTPSERAALKWAWSQRGLTPAQKLVLVGLVLHLTAEGYAFVSKAVLRRGAGIDRTTVSKSIAALSERNLVRVQPTSAEDGGTLANRYYLALAGEDASHE